jgi:hypothetical protein
LTSQSSQSHHQQQQQQAQPQSQPQATRGTIHVRQMQWTDPKTNLPGTYTGQVNAQFVPHGHGLMEYDGSNGAVKEGEWKNGRYRRSNNNNNESGGNSRSRSKSRDGRRRSRSRSTDRRQEVRSSSRSAMQQQQPVAC